MDEDCVLHVLVGYRSIASVYLAPMNIGRLLEGFGMGAYASNSDLYRSEPALAALFMRWVPVAIFWLLIR